MRRPVLLVAAAALIGLLPSAPAAAQAVPVTVVVDDEAPAPSPEPSQNPDPESPLPRTGGNALHLVRDAMAALAAGLLLLLAARRTPERKPRR